MLQSISQYDTFFFLAIIRVNFLTTATWKGGEVALLPGNYFFDPSLVCSARAVCHLPTSCSRRHHDIISTLISLRFACHSPAPGAYTVLQRGKHLDWTGRCRWTVFTVCFYSKLLFLVISRSYHIIIIIRRGSRKNVAVPRSSGGTRIHTPLMFWSK